MKSIYINNSKLVKTVLILLISLFSIFFTHKVLAIVAHQSIVDVYGTQKFTGDDALKKCGNIFQKISNFLQSSQGYASQHAMDKESIYYPVIRAKLEGKEKFSYFNITPIRYQDDDNVYYTIDVVEQKDAYRLKVFLPKPDKSIPDPDGLLASWQEYENVGWNKFRVNKEEPKQFKCPVTHCLFGFDEPEFLRFKDIFMVGAIINKSKLIDILYNDRDDDKRANAAFMLGNLTDTDEVIKIMIPAMNDSSDSVRNNVMRVIFMAVDSNKEADFPIDSAIAAVDYPTGYDRNKAMYILYGLAQQPRYAAYLKIHAARQIMTQLKMLQPDVHLPAYQILKRISGKSYGERDYATWQSWLDNKSL